MGDFRHAFRALSKQRAFAGVAILTLAFGIGVNTSLFSIVSAFFLQPLPIDNAHELVLVMQRGRALNVPYGHSYPDYLDYREATTALSDLVAYMPTPAHLSAPGRTPERTWVEIVSPNYFALARVSPAFGEFPRSGDRGGKGGDPAVVLSYRYWQRRFGGDPSLVGRPITINGRSFTVTGIAPESFTGFSFAMAVSAFVPSGAMGSVMDNGDAFRDNRGAPAWRLIGRLKPGMTLDQARAEVEVVAKRLAAAYPVEHEGSRVLVIPENRARPDPSVAEFLPVFAAVFAAMVALVLLIACANVANLMLSRAVVRQRDLVIRSALGATRFRLIRLQVAESLVLAAAGGVLAIVLAHWAGVALGTLMSAGDIPVNDQRRWDWRVYLFTVVISAVAGVAAAMWPARTATRFDVAESLKDGATVGATSRHVIRNLLVIAQVTLSLVVLASAAMFVQSLRHMENLALGFEPRGLLMMSIDLGLQQYDDARGLRFIEELLTRARAVPGVQAATVVTHVPFDYGMQITDVAIGGDIPGAADGYVSTAYTVVGSSFFETTGSIVARGRAFDTSDHERSRRVAIVNQTMARKLWPGREAIGSRFRFGRNGPWIEVVGVARDGRYLMIGEEPRAYFYLPLAQEYRSPTTLVVRSASDLDGLVTPLRRILNGMDRNLPVFNVRSMETHIEDSVFGLMPMRIGANLAGAQGLVALLLAVMGLYAVVSYAVSRRIREIGVRMALGAQPRAIAQLVLREGLRLSVVGIGIGLPAASGVGLVLSSVLYGVRPFDASVFAGVTALVLLVSVLACYIPARRATRVDPLTALRYQ